MTGSPIHRQLSTSRFLDTIVEILCSVTQIQPECVQNLLDIWWHGAVFSISNHSQSAIGIIKRKILANPDDEIVERIIVIFQHIAKSSRNEKSVYNSMCSGLIPTNGEWKSLMNETNASHLMAKEYIINGSSSVSAFSTIRSVNVKAWSGLIKVAYVVSSISLDSVDIKENEDSVHILANLHYASTAADLLLSLFVKRFKVQLYVLFKIPISLNLFMLAIQNSFISSCII